MSAIELGGFEAFVKAVHGHDPFPWQMALVEEIAARRAWPDVIDVPTGLGKTSVIDAFVFLSALQPTSTPTRLFFVVDRRVVVDEAFEHATAIAHALGQADQGIAADVARALRRSERGREPLHVTRMRGGLTWAGRWLDRPDLPAVVVGTVAQLGSRLFFRGYGVGQYWRSMDAALVGADSVIVMDEAHLATPMLQSFDTAMGLDAPDAVHRPILVTMSATTNERAGWTHRWSEADARHKVAGRRLRAAKRLVTTEVSPSKAKADAVVADAMARIALELVGRGARRVGIVANTVARARLVYERVQDNDVDASLLTGRMREYDRQRWHSESYEKVRAGSGRRESKPVVQVATQTIEVGVNLDFDALVTESASLDALVQRLGRLNRLADFDETSPVAVVVHDASVTADDPVYRAARLNTWDWLSTVCPPQPLKGLSLEGGIDAGPAALRTLVDGIVPADRQAMVRPEVPVPVLTAERLDCLARTSPTPEPDLDVTPFLYGFRDDSPEVTVVWRAGMDKDSSAWADEINLAPPSPDEGLELPLAIVRRWLRGLPGADQVGDGPLEIGDETEQGGEDREVLMLMPDGEWTAVRPGGLRPNSVVVVPVEYGGIDEFGWAPASREVGSDVGALVLQRGTRVVRLGPALANVLPGNEARIGQLVSDLGDADGNLEELVGAFVDDVVEVIAPSAVELIAALREKLDVKLVDGATTVALAVCKVRGGAASVYAEDSSVAGSSVMGTKVELGPHQEQVAELAETYARNLRLEPKITASIGRAARQHDEGKRDPRFQAMLYNGDRLHAEAGATLLAKSGMDPADRSGFRRAAAVSGYPRGMRHEALSARIAVARLQAVPDENVDADLVVHLAASHHGRSRPLLPPVADHEPHAVDVPGLAETFKTDEVVDWDGPARFERLNRRYGYWGLALFEAILRSADIAASEEPDRGFVDGD